MEGDSPSAADLSFATFEELVDEIKRRSYTALVVAEREDKIDLTIVYTFMMFKGTSINAMGLADYARRRAYDGLMSRQKEEDQ